MYYVQYVVQPEYTNGCTAGDPDDPTNLNLLQQHALCDSHWVAAYALVFILTCAIAALPFWQALSKLLGKRRAWLAWSGVNALTNLALVVVGQGDVWLFIAVAGLNGVPLGATFLSDSILSDIIDYDELLTGTRNEATYTMFKSFLPKMCAIPASVIPISILASVGYIAPQYGVPQKQPGTLYTPLTHFSRTLLSYTLLMHSLIHSSQHTPLIHRLFIRCSSHTQIWLCFTYGRCFVSYR
jgi:Na+/melibiose symporter-like transporter